MSTTGRRNLLKSFLALPFVHGTFGRFIKEGPQLLINDAAFEQKYLAVRILRHINTVQAWHKREVKHYAGVNEFISSPTVRKFLDAGTAERAGLGASFYSQLKFDAKEIVPGWRFTLTLSDGRQRYMASVSPVNGDEFPAFSTDERGIIYQGRPLDAGSPTNVATADRMLESSMPIRHMNKFGLRYYLESVVGGLAFAPKPLICACRACRDYPCCFDPCCSCASDCPGLVCCIDCGCESCVWCIG
jgi:hypothetical protein